MQGLACGAEVAHGSFLVHFGAHMGLGTCGDWVCTTLAYLTQPNLVFALEK